jgi:hypothetical protein
LFGSPKALVGLGFQSSLEPTQFWRFSLQKNQLGEEAEVGMSQLLELLKDGENREEHRESGFGFLRSLLLDLLHQAWQEGVGHPVFSLSEGDQST